MSEPSSHFPVLETQRLLLRETSPADAPVLFAIHSDADAMRWFGTEPLPDEQAAQKVIEGWATARTLANPGIRWGIERRDDGRLIGTCGMFRWNRHWRACMVGYELAREAWGQGYMRETLLAVLGFGFVQMQLNRVEAQVHPDNVASLKLVERLGFVREGLLREAGWWGGQAQDLVQFSLLRREQRVVVLGE
jgi:ribosomal-protein-alanine N-acetyltransferase